MFLPWMEPVGILWIVILGTSNWIYWYLALLQIYSSCDKWYLNVSSFCNAFNYEKLEERFQMTQFSCLMVSMFWSYLHLSFYCQSTKLRVGNVFQLCLSISQSFSVQGQGVGGYLVWPLPMLHWTSTYKNPTPHPLPRHVQTGSLWRPPYFVIFQSQFSFLFSSQFTKKS